MLQSIQVAAAALLNLMTSALQDSAKRCHPQEGSTVTLQIARGFDNGHDELGGVAVDNCPVLQTLLLSSCPHG